MSSTREHEAHNQLFPLQNATGMKSQANLLVGATGIVQNLASLFGGLMDGHYLTAQADGGKVYTTWSSNDLGATLLVNLTGYAIDPAATGSGRQVCWPIPDGVMLPGVPYGGLEKGTTSGFGPAATGIGMTLVRGYQFLHARMASGGVATGYLRLYRSSLAPTQDVREFKIP
jgi:hypothetical protein